MADTERLTTAATHPLEPLAAQEISRAVQILRAEQELDEGYRFAGSTLREPAKDRVLAFERGNTNDGSAPAREVEMVLLHKPAGDAYEAIVSLSEGRTLSFEHVSGVHPPVLLEEFDQCEAACKESPEYQEVLARRGITDMEAVIVDPWSAGSYGDEEGRRLSRALSWVRMGAGDNPYAHPIENVIAIVDLNTMEVVRVEDHGVVPVPEEPGNYTPEAAGERQDLRPVEISQPEGVSFEIDGHEIRWQKWRFRIGFTPREGLVLHTVSYADGGRERPVLYRASLSEMVVPYGDPSPGHWRKNAFDAGEYNIGTLANSLELGCDCLGEIRYFDAVLSNGDGEPMTIKNAVCLHEEDAGMLWKHYDMRTGDTEVRRSRRLVVSFVATVANYEYGFYWHLYQDGKIEFEVKLTGIVSTGAVADGQSPAHGQLLNTEGLYGPIHQHLFNLRIDLDVDGQNNALYEVNTESVPPGEENPHGNAYLARQTPLRTESEAQREVDPLSARYWKVVNHDIHNSLGEPVAYKLVSQGNVRPFFQPDASVAARAAFATRHLWATPYEPAERHAAGDYPNQHPGGAGLPDYTATDRALEDQDLVLWYTLGAHHTVRPEDWPVMPVQHAGFELQPAGFFDYNPALDVLRPGGNGHCHS